MRFACAFLRELSEKERVVPFFFSRGWLKQEESGVVILQTTRANTNVLRALASD